MIRKIILYLSFYRYWGLNEKKFKNCLKLWE